MKIVNRAMICENCGYCEEIYEDGRQFFQCIRVMKETSLHDTCDDFTPNARLFNDE